MLLQKSFILLLLLTIISLISCEGGNSLTFVIDDSGSMEDDIDQVRRGASGIMDIVLKHKSSKIKDIVLVTFNDPIRLTLLRKKTRDRNELQTALNAIVAHNEDNYDWPELSMSGIELALQESQPGSYLYVFTDASAKDYRNAGIVINLCQKTQSQIIFVLTDYCNTKSEIECIVYHQIAEACSGQVFIVDKNEISKVLEYVKETVKGDKNIITTRKVPAFKKTAIQFTVDDKTEYALISVSGDKAIISDMRGPSSNYETIVSTSNVKVLKLSNPVPGSYELQVYGESQVSVIIFGRTDFVFDHGFSEMTPKSLQDTSKQPISGTKNHLSISVIDPDHEVNINTAQILNMNEEIIYELPLTKTANDFYITGQFVAPNSMFKVAVKGRVIKTGKDIRRISKTSVEPQKPKIKPIEQKAPVSLISEGSKMNTEYDSTFQLTCKVTGYPAPTIIWKDDKGQVLKSKSYPVELPYKYISYLSLSHVKKSGKYFCYGSNALDNTHSSIDVTVLPAFKVDRNSQAPVNVHYGKDAVVHCKIESSLPRRIIWFRTMNNKPVEQIRSSGIYTISSDGTELKIKDMKINLQGKYTCKASLVADENVNAIFDMQVKIDDLAKPEINQKNPTLTIIENRRVYIPCKIINGIPKPKITWIFQSRASGTLQSLPNTGEQIEIISSKLSDAGHYTCTAQNELGKVQKHTELIVEAPPTIITDDKKEIYVAAEGDRVLKVPCKTVGYPKPVITWKAFGRPVNTGIKYAVQEDGTLAIQNPMERDTSDTYVCEAKNKLSTASEKFYVNVKSKPKIDQSKTTITIMEKTHVYIPCKIINGNPKPKITWMFQSKASGTLQSLPNTGEQIEIISSKLSDAGHYTCSAENELGKVQKHTELIVEAPPTIITDDKKEIYVAAEGDRVLKVPCKTVGYPKPVITWKAFGHPVNTDHKYVVEEDGTLAILKPVERDTNDTYICEATNKLSSASEKFHVIVTSYLIHDDHFGNWSEIYLLGGETKQVKCVLPHEKTDSVRWYKNGLETNITGSFLDFISATQDYDGNYTCRVSNNLGSNSHTFEVDVGYAPRFKLNSVSTEIDWKGNRKDIVNCDASSKPVPTVKWTYNGKNVEGASTTQLKIFDWGDYTCELSNPHGVLKRHFKVTSKDCLIDRSNNAAPNMPLILTNSPTWQDLETQNEFLILKSGASVKLSCNNQASNLNSFASLSNKKEVTATCDHNNNLLVDGKVYKLSGLGCKSEVMPDVVRTSSKCLSDNTELIKVGFNVDGFVNVYEVCYDTIQHLPLYARSKMSDINKFASVSEYKWYNYPGIADSKSDKRYTCQKGSKKCCFSKNQMVSAQDVHYGPPQTSTFIDHLNAIPIWQPCEENRITWQSLEDIVRDKYEEESEFSVWSGTSKPVTVNGATIPRYLWKVVISDQSEAMAMVYVNDPAPVPSDIMCENVCDNDIHPWDKKSDRFTYCCRLEDFVKAFNFTINTFDAL